MLGNNGWVISAKITPYSRVFSVNDQITLTTRLIKQSKGRHYNRFNVNYRNICIHLKDIYMTIRFIVSVH